MLLKKKISKLGLSFTYIENKIQSSVLHISESIDMFQNTVILEFDYYWTDIRLFEKIRVSQYLVEKFCFFFKA